MKWNEIRSIFYVSICLYIIQVDANHTQLPMHWLTLIIQYDIAPSIHWVLFPSSITQANRTCRLCHTHTHSRFICTLFRGIFEFHMAPNIIIYAIWIQQFRIKRAKQFMSLTRTNLKCNSDSFASRFLFEEKKLSFDCHNFWYLLNGSFDWFDALHMVYNACYIVFIYIHDCLYLYLFYFLLLFCHALFT